MISPYTQVFFFRGYLETRKVSDTSNPFRLVVVWLVIMRPYLGAALYVALRPFVFLSVRLSRGSDFLEIGNP